MKSAKELDWLDHPIFICGHPKSGTTLLVSILDGHSSIVMLPEEILFFQRVYWSNEPRKALGERFHSILHSAETGEPWKDRKGVRSYAHLDSAILRSRLRVLAASSCTWQDLLKVAPQAYFESNPDLANNRKQIKFWAEKTPSQEHFAPTLSKWFDSKSKFVYVLRDPRDVFSSYRKLHPDLTVKAFATRWGTSFVFAGFMKLTNSNFVALKYEALVKDPEREISCLLSELKLELEPVCLTPTISGRDWTGIPSQDIALGGISSSRIGAYAGDVNVHQLSELERLLFIPMWLAGYKCETRKFPSFSSLVHFSSIILHTIALGRRNNRRAKPFPRTTEGEGCQI